MASHKAKQRAVAAMVRRWRRDQGRLGLLFGDYGPDNTASPDEVQRNLDTAIVWAEMFLAMAPPPRTHTNE